MIDRTADFAKILKEVRERDGFPRPSILATKSKKARTEFGSKCRDLVQSISQLRDFLLENRKSYVGDVGQRNELTDVDRDKIDIESQTIIKRCSEALMQLRLSEIKDKALVSQLDAHKKYTTDLIEKYLKNVCDIYSKQKSIRVQQVVNRRRIARLQQNGVSARRLPTSDEVQDQPKFIPKVQPKLHHSDDDLSSEDESIYEQENAQLLHDMNSMMDEVNAIENQVVEIAKLQEMFSEQVLQQSEQADLISETIVESSENVKDGNEELREAIKNNAGFRVWILFFLVMCSFSLLFLEWYS